MSRQVNITKMEATIARAVVCPFCEVTRLRPCLRKKVPHPERVLLAQKRYPRLWWDLNRTLGDVEKESRCRARPRWDRTFRGDLVDLVAAPKEQCAA